MIRQTVLVICLVWSQWTVGLWGAAVAYGSVLESDSYMRYALGISTTYSIMSRLDRIVVICKTCVLLGWSQLIPTMQPFGRELPHIRVACRFCCMNSCITHRRREVLVLPHYQSAKSLSAAPTFRSNAFARTILKIFCTLIEWEVEQKILPRQSRMAT